MEKADIAKIAKKAKKGADDGIKKAGGLAKKAAGKISDGLDDAKENKKKTSLTKGAVKELRDVIKELEKEKRATTLDGVYEETVAIIGQLKDLSQRIKNDPDNCDEAIGTLASDYKKTINELLENESVGEELLKMQVMSKRYKRAMNACILAKTALEEDRIRNKDAKYSQ